MLAVEKIYVAHYKPLEERKKNLLNIFSNLSLNVDWIEEEPDDLFLKEKYDYSKNWEQKLSELQLKEHHEKRILKKSEISLLYKHFKIYEDIVKNNIKTALILEDDIILSNNFIKDFNFSLYMTPRDWDFIFIGSGCNLKIEKNKIKDGVIAYLKEHPASKCTDSYVMKLSSAKKIINTFTPFTFAIDYELNYQMFKHNMNVYWWEPPVTSQGSQCGLYRSEIQ
jgi:GR25 family glycosyltransferase involved in LPS biosynthesis